VCLRAGAIAVRSQGAVSALLSIDTSLDMHFPPDDRLGSSRDGAQHGAFLSKPWRKKWQPNPIFLPGKSHGQRSLAGYSPWGCKSQT